MIQANKTLFVVFSDIFIDSRALLFAEEASKYSEVTVISLESNSTENNQYSFKHHPIKLKSDGRMLFRWYEFIKKTRAFITQTIKLSVFNSIVASDLYALPIASWAKKINPKLNLIYDSREVYSALGSLSNRPITQKIITSIESKYIRNVDRVSISGEMDMEYVKSYFPKHLDYFVIKNLPPYKEVESSNYLRDRFNIPFDQKIAIYQGAISEGRGIEKSINAFSNLTNWSLCIVGQGTHYEKYRNNAKKYPNIYFTGSIPYETLHSVTCSAYLGLSLIEPLSLSYQYALPNKLFEYFMAGLPVLASDMQPILEIINEVGGGRIISGNFEVETIIDAMNSFEEDDLHQLKTEAVAAAKKYNYSSQSHLIEKILSI